MTLGLTQWSLSSMTMECLLLYSCYKWFLLILLFIATTTKVYSLHIAETLTALSLWTKKAIATEIKITAIQVFA